MSAEAFWIRAPGSGEIRSEPLPPPADGELRVRTQFSGISKGTESLVWQGRIPASEHARMRAPAQAGDFPGPVKYGYCNVGVVEAGPADWIGREVFCLQPHQTYFNVAIDAACPLPAGLPAERAILAANAETALNACWDAAPLAGERITVIGAGVIGSLTAALCATLPGTEVELIDHNPARQALAEQLGIPFAAPAAARHSVDRVIHASGSEAGLHLALRIAGFEATIIELSWFGDQMISLPLGAAFHAQRLTLRASQVGQLPAAMQGRWDHRRRLEKALALLATHPQWSVLIDQESSFADLPERYGEILQGDGLCHRIRY